MIAVQPQVMATPSAEHGVGPDAAEVKGAVNSSNLQERKWIQNCLFELELQLLSFYLR